MSDAVPVSVPVSFVPGSQTPIPATVQATSGNSLPPSGKSASKLATTDPTSPLRANAQSLPKAAKPTATSKSTVDEVVQQLNKYLNDSGRANTFRVDPASRDQTIQEINPATGEVIGEFAVTQFPALVRSLGISGVLVDSHA
jgi:uncharacterized FlaG/YvyC family protein